MTTEDRRQALREYKRRWNAANPERVREHKRRYFERKVRRAAEDLLRQAAENSIQEDLRNENERTF